MGDNKRVIQGLIEKLDEYLQGKGFERSEKSANEILREWRRPNKWKIDDVTLHLKWGKDVYISFMILFPKKGKGSEKYPFIIFDQIQSGRLCKEPGQHYRIPLIGFLSSGFANKTIAKVDSVIDWFDQYNDIDNCFRRLREMYAGRAGSEEEKESFAYLQAVRL